LPSPSLTNVAQETPDMSAKPSNKSEHRSNSAEIIDMTAVAEAAKLLREVAAPVPAGDSVKAAIGRAASRVGKHIAPHFAPRWHAGRAEDIWRGEARGVWAEEMDAIRRAADAKSAEEARSELAELDARLARLEALLVQDEDFNRPQVDAWRASSRGPDRPVD
jgi:diadenosine tetraphosphate (Ap4A) HIT family hydrolase